MVRFFCILFCILFFQNYILSQEISTKKLDDSIKTVFKNPSFSSEEKVKIASLLVLTYNYLDPDSKRPLELANENLTIAHQTGDKKYIVYAFCSKMLLEKDSEKAIIAMDSCLWYIEHCDDDFMKAYGYRQLGILKQKSIEGLQYYLKALDIIRGKGYWEEERNLYNNITTYYRMIGDHTNSVKYAELSLDAARKGGDMYVICEAMNDLGVAYDETSYEDMHNKAFELYKNAIEAFEENRSKNVPGFENPYVYVVLLINIADSYEKKEDYISAERSVNEALLYCLQHDTPQLITECYTRLSTYAQIQKDYTKAINYLLKIIDLTAENEIVYPGSSHIRYETELSLAHLYHLTGDYKKASDYFQKGFEGYKETHNQEIAKNAAELEAAYQSSKKEQELNFLHQSMEMKRIQNYLLIGVVILLIIGILLIYLFSKYKITTIKQREKIQEEERTLLQLSKEKAELKTKLLTEEAKVNQLETERMQKEVMIGGLLVEHKNSIMQQMRYLFMDNPGLRPYKQKLESILVQESRVDDSFDDIKTDLKEIHPLFYNKLQQKAENKLTSLDLKYCACILMKMSSKEMADVFNVEPHTIRVNKYRLKQKLRLTKDEDLNTYIQNTI